MQVEKVRYKDGEGAELAWSVPNGSDREARTLACDDVPEESFVAALEALRPLIARANELPEDYAEKITVHTVSVGRDQHGLRRLIVSGTVSVGAGKYAMSTPNLREPAELIDEGGPSQLTADDLELVDVLCAEVARYINGARLKEEPAKPIEAAPRDPFAGDAEEEQDEDAEQLVGAGVGH
ncbi:MAG: hypothetical protein OEW52_00230 [Thermoleophilia bacterium]|nr:hypothetical protein [Thermoleophilia bacterium]